MESGNRQILIILLVIVVVFIAWALLNRYVLNKKPSQPIVVTTYDNAQERVVQQPTVVFVEQPAPTPVPNTIPGWTTGKILKEDANSVCFEKAKNAQCPKNIKRNGFVYEMTNPPMGMKNACCFKKKPDVVVEPPVQTQAMFNGVKTEYANPLMAKF